MNLILLPDDENHIKLKLTIASQKVFKDITSVIRVLIMSKQIHFDFTYMDTIWFKDLTKLKKEIDKLSVTATDFETFKVKKVLKLRVRPHLFSVTATGRRFIRVSIVIDRGDLGIGAVVSDTLIVHVTAEQPWHCTFVVIAVGRVSGD